MNKNARIIRPTDRAAWLEARKGGIGSSEVGTILGLNPFESPYQLWRRKRGMDAPKEETFAMRAGHYLEEAVSLFYRDETGREVIKSSAGDWLIVDTARPWMRVSPDRTFWLPGLPHSPRNKGILECKTTQREVCADDVPQHWYCQLQYQLGVAGMERGSLAWLVRGREFGWTDVELDAEFFSYLTGQVEEFWRKNVIGGEEPPAYTAADVLLKYPRSAEGKSVSADGCIEALCRELAEVKAEAAAVDLHRREIEEQVKLAMGDAERLTSEATGRTLATWRTAKDGTRRFVIK